MSNLALTILIETGFLLPSGKVCNIASIPWEEISRRLHFYAKARKQTAAQELSEERDADSINALFSTTSAKITRQRLLSSALVYKSIAIDDPLINSNTQISAEKLKEALSFYSWSFNLIKAGILKTLPISLLSLTRKEIPIWHSEDAFRSSVPETLHDFIHQSAQLKSVIKDDNNKFLILPEKADLNRRPAIHVSFANDYWTKGASLYLFQTMEPREEMGNDEISVRLKWDPKYILSKEKFAHWKYQVVNQAIRARLMNIKSECELAKNIGHTYITESNFESKLLAAATGNSTNIHQGEPATRFLEANNSFINIASPSTIIEIRLKFPDGFRRFHYSLLEIGERLSKVPPENFEKEARRIFHLEIMPQIDQFKDNINSISANAAKGSLVSLGGFAAAFATGSTLPLIGMLMSNVASSMTEAFPSISQYQLLKSRPSYIWHRLTSTSGKA